MERRTAVMKLDIESGHVDGWLWSSTSPSIRVSLAGWRQAYFSFADVRLLATIESLHTP